MPKMNTGAANAREPLLRAILARIKEIEGVEHDYEAGAALGGSRSTVDQWKNRGTIPWLRLFDYAIRRDISLDWLVAGRGPKRLGQLIEEPSAIYKVRTNQDLVYLIAGMLYQALQERQAVIPRSTFEQIVRYLHRSAISKGLDTVLYTEVEALLEIALAEE